MNDSDKILYLEDEIRILKTQLREVRGENSVYHNNCIQTWYVNEQGIAENVEVS